MKMSNLNISHNFRLPLQMTCVNILFLPIIKSFPAGREKRKPEQMVVKLYQICMPCITFRNDYGYISNRIASLNIH